MAGACCAGSSRRLWGSNRPRIRGDGCRKVSGAFLSRWSVLGGFGPLTGKHSTFPVAQNYSQAFGYHFYFAPLLKGQLDFSELNSGLAGFLDISTLLSNDADVHKSGTGATLKMGAGTAKVITKAAVASNVATLTFAAAHGISNAAVISVYGLPAPFAGLNGTHTVTAVTTSSPYTLSFALTAANQAEATVASGKVLGSFLSLDGSDDPIRLLGLTNAAPSETEKEETIQTYDDEQKSFETSLATGKGFSFKLEGVTDHRDAAYQLMRICSKESVTEGLMVKYARIGPVGFNEATYGYGRFTGFDETPPAGGIVKWSNTIKAYGRYELDFTT